MKDEKDKREEIPEVSSSVSQVLETVDLTLRPATHDNLTPEILGNELDDSGTAPTTSRQGFRDNQEETIAHRVTTSQPNLRVGPRADFHVFRSLGGGIINSTSAMHNEQFVQKTGKKSFLKIPPSYSTVLKQCPPLTLFDSRTYPSVPFIARQPPPSYAEVHGWDDNPSAVSSESFSLGPNPIYVSCPRCRTVVVSDVHTERSHLSYVTSILLCLCLCWPCCLLPYCLKSCYNSYHFCPTCHHYLGVYKPC